MRRETGFRDGFIDREMMMMVCSHIILITRKEGQEDEKMGRSIKEERDSRDIQRK